MDMRRFLGICVLYLQSFGFGCWVFFIWFYSPYISGFQAFSEKLLCSLPALRFLHESVSWKSSLLIFSILYSKLRSFCNAKNKESSCCCSDNAPSFLKRRYVAFIVLRGIGAGKTCQAPELPCSLMEFTSIPFLLPTDSCPSNDLGTVVLMKWKCRCWSVFVVL